jgi:hypothetical protein
MATSFSIIGSCSMWLSYSKYSEPRMLSCGGMGDGGGNDGARGTWSSECGYRKFHILLIGVALVLLFEFALSSIDRSLSREVQNVNTKLPLTPFAENLQSRTGPL